MERVLVRHTFFPDSSIPKNVYIVLLSASLSVSKAPTWKCTQSNLSEVEIAPFLCMWNFLFRRESGCRETLAQETNDMGIRKQKMEVKWAL